MVRMRILMGMDGRFMTLAPADVFIQFHGQLFGTAAQHSKQACAHAEYPQVRR
jgi:hypothetical protein